MKIIEIGPGGVALGDEHDHWLLLSAAPEIAQHALLDAAARDGRLAGVVLLDAQLEHAARLAALSRAHPLALYATPGVFEALTTRLPRLGDLRWHPLPVAGDVRSAEFGVEGMASLRCVAVDADADADAYDDAGAHATVGARLALIVEDRYSGQRLAYSARRGAGARGAAGLEIAR
ncbi:MAG: hypothetical protein JSR75_13020 [Proteobacteria bacterium]|nr:hypothetical protein [Pseudomonadota bacterium]